MANETWYQGLLGALEPRLMYDGAAVATAATTLPDADGGAEAAASVAPGNDGSVSVPDAQVVADALAHDPAEATAESTATPTGASTSPDAGLTGANTSTSDQPLAEAQVMTSIDQSEASPTPDAASMATPADAGAPAATASEPAAPAVYEETSAPTDSSAETGLRTSTGDTEEQSLTEAVLAIDPIAAVAPHEIAFVDAGLENYQELVDAINPAIEVFVVDSGVDGWDFMAGTLSQKSGIDAIHILGHGSSGSATLGTATLSQASLEQYSGELAAIGQSLTEKGDILLYGCNTGEGESGTELITSLSATTGADIAASTDATGAENLGGDWTLETATGAIETNSLVAERYGSVLGTPSISQLNGASYTEQGAPLILDNDILFANGSDYRGGYLDFYLTDATTADFLTLSADAGVSTINGAISIAGTTVYMGNGSGAAVVGSVDATYNGQNGQRLRINFSNEFTNGDFQTGSDGSTIITGWTAVNEQIHLNGIDQIAGQATPVDATWPGSNGSIHDLTYFQSGEPTRETYLSTTYQTNGDLAIRMDTGDTNITQGYGIIRGPYVYSNGTVSLQQGDQVSFAWKALSGGDAYDAYGYIINVNTGATITILDQTGAMGSTETSWAASTTTVGAGQAGEYRFVFVCGSYDATGGMYVGGELMIDDVSVIQANPSDNALTDAQIGAIAHRVLYNNTADDPGSQRTLQVSAQNSEGLTGTAQTTLIITQLNDAPSLTSGATLAAVAEDATSPAGSSIASLFSGKLSDPDNAAAPYDSLAGLVIGGDSSTSAQGEWQYSTDGGSSWFAVGSVSAASGLVLDASAQLRFLPGQNYNGTPGSLSVYAVDSSYGGSYTSGATRQTFDATIDGSSSAVSAATVALSTSVTAVNDAPVMDAPAGNTINDTAALDDFAPVTGTLTATDADSTGFTYAITSAGVTGDSLTDVIQGTYGTLTLAKATGGYTYTPNDISINALPAGSTVTDTFTVSVSDGQLTDSRSLVITLNGHDDAPIFGEVEGGSSSSGTTVIADGGTATSEGIEILDNGSLRFGDGTIDSVNAATGMLEQPWYYDAGTWYKLTFSSYQLNFAIAAEGDGTNEWNQNGTINMTPTFTNATVDNSGYVADGDYGKIIYTGYITLGSTDLKVAQVYELSSNGSFIKATTQVTNVDTTTASNLRIWVGTQDDWIALTDAPAKMKGNIVDGEFVPITSAEQQASAIKVYSGDTAVLFYSTSDKANTITYYHYSWPGVIGTDPQLSVYDQSYDDGAYGMYVRMNDLAPGQSESFDWFYAAGAIEDINGIISNVAQAAAVGLSEGNSGLTSSGTYTVSDIDNGDVVNVNLTSVAAAQQDMAGNPVTASSFQPSNADLLAMLSVSPELVVDAGHTEGSLTWSFDSGAEAFNYLKAGERLVLTYTLTATDGQEATASQTVEITINGSDDRPVNSVPGSQTIDEDTTLVFSDANGNSLSLGITDDEVITATVSAGAGKGSLTVTNPGDLTVLNNGTATIQLQGSRAEINAALQGLTYTPTLNGNGTGYATLTLTSSDGVTADTDTVTLNLNPVDDLPTATDMAAMVGPNSKQLFSEFVPVFGDVDNDQPVALRLLNDPTVGQFEVYNGSGDRLDDANWTVISGITAQAPLVVAMNQLANYRFNAGQNEGQSTNINWQVQTAGNTTGSGWSNVANGVITVLDPGNNAAPVVNIKTADGSSLNSGNATIVEDGNLPGIKLIFSDDYTPEEFMQGIIQSSNTDLLDMTGISSTRSTTNAPGDTVTFTFTPKANMYGTTTITLGAYDGEKSGSQSFVLTVSPVNETPVAQDFLRVIDEDHSFSFSTIDPAAIYADANDANANANTGPVVYSEQMAVIMTGQQENATPEQQAAAGAAVQTLIDASLFPKQFVVETLPEHGSLMLYGQAITSPNTAIATADLAELIYRPDANYYGTDSFSWHGADQAPDGTNGLASASKVATFTVNPINDAPVISNGPDTSALTETDAALQASGSLTVGDVDIPDTVTGSVAGLTVAGTNSDDPFAPDFDTLKGMLSLSPTIVLNSTASSAALAWQFDSDRTTFDFLAKDETLVLTYTIEVTDNNATQPDGTVLTANETVTITITGTNDAPVITILTGDSGSSALIETDAPLSSQGTLSITDLDTSDVVQVATSVVAVQKAADGSTMLPDVNEPANAALLAMFSATQQPVDGEHQEGSIAWSFDSGAGPLNEAFDYLAQGEQLVLTYSLTATDSQGTATIQDVTVTITGTNDVPVITVEGNDIDAAGLREGNAPLAATGALTVGDLDTTDIVTVTTEVSALQKNASGTVMTSDINEPANAALLSMFNATRQPVDGGHQEGVIAWSFDSGADPLNEAFDYLAAGERLVLTYTVTATDSQGTAASHDVIVTITGTNDAPVLTMTSPSLNTITEDMTGNPGQLISSFLGSTDLDSTNPQGIAIYRANGANGVWQFSTSNGSSWQSMGAVSTGAAMLLRSTDKIRFVPDGANGASPSFDFRAWDQSAGVAGTKADVSAPGGGSAFSSEHGTASLTVTAVNDAPTANGSVPDQTGQQGQPWTLSLPATLFQDVDNGDGFSYSATGLPAGISLSGGSLMFSGTPAEAGTFTVVIQARDRGGAVATMSFTLTIDAAIPPAPPAPPLPGGIAPPVPVAPLSPIEPIDTSLTGYTNSGNEGATGNGDGSNLVGGIDVTLDGNSGTALLDENAGLSTTPYGSGVPQETGVLGLGTDSNTPDAALAQSLAAFSASMRTNNNTESIQVTETGEIVFEHEGNRATVDGLFVKSLAVGGNSLKLEVGDAGSAHLQAIYTATLKNGVPLPGWLTIDPASGTIQGNPPEEMEVIELEIIATDLNGNVKILHVKIKLNESGQAEVQRTETPTSAFWRGPVYQSFSQQLAEASMPENYGEKLITALAAA